MDRRTIAHYRILEKLGEGGMGQVFLAEDVHLDRRTAIKILAPEFSGDPERLGRFRREAKAIAALNHPNIVTIYSVEEDDDLQFFTMELIEGRTLDKVIPAGGLPLESLFDIAVPLADALSAAHGRGITHRDLKPGNIMITDEGRVKILDFGLAKLREGDPGSGGAGDRPDELTTDGHILGTVPYMSPEQVKGIPIDHRSDIFALGVILYELATGERPFKGETTADLVSSILRDEPCSVTQLNTRLPRHLGRVIRQCLEKNPSDRLQTALDVRNQLRDLRRELTVEAVLDSGKSRPVSAPRFPERWLEWRAPLGIPALVSRRTGLSLLLLLVFAVNYAETAIETKLKADLGLGVALADELAAAVHWLEGGLSFEGHEATNVLAAYSFSVAYFFLFPLLGIATGVAAWRREAISPFRVLCLAIVIVYAISLPFYVFVPVPERWSFPDSGATLLSDRWSSRLIETFRPISGLDNCLPSSHVSLTVVVVWVCYAYRFRLRTVALALGLTVVLATFVLGIHWLADIVAGLAVGVVGVGSARRIDRFLLRPASTRGVGGR